MSAIRSLTGVDRTWHGLPISVAIDPKETSSSSAFQRVCRVDASDAPANRFPREGHEPVDPRPVHSRRSELPSSYPAAVSTAGLVPLLAPLGSARLTPPQPPRHR